MPLSVSVLAAWAANSTHTITSGSFTPAANSLVVVCTGCGNGPGITVTGLTVSDSVSGSWSDLVHLTAGGQFADASVWVKDAGASPSSQTVTVSLTPTSVLDIGLVVLQVTGAAPAASQTGVTNKSTSSATVTLTPGTTGSQVVGAAGWAGTTAVTANGSSTLYGQTHDSTNGASEGAFFATSTSTGGTPLTVGFTSAPAGVGMAAAEILPATSTTWNGTLTTAATAGASFGGTKTGLASLTTTATAHATFAGTKTGLASLAASVTAHTVLSGTKTGLGHLSPAATAHAVFTGTRTQFGNLTASVTAHTVVSGTKTGLGHLSPAATAHAAFSGTRTMFGNLAAAATAHTVIAGTRAKFGQLTTAVTARVTLAGTKTALGHLTTSATARTVFAGTRTALGHLNAAVTAGVSFAATHVASRPPQNLGALLSQVNYAGANAIAPVLSGANSLANTLGMIFSQTAYAGTAVVNSPLGVSVSQVNLGGSITMITLSGSATGWTMQNINLSLAEFNDIALSTTITSGGSALNLTGMTVKMLLKPTAGVVDTDPSVKSVTATIVTPSAGLCTINIPHSDLQSQTLTFYRIDVIDGSGDINTAAYGTVTYTAL